MKLSAAFLTLIVILGCSTTDPADEPRRPSRGGGRGFERAGRQQSLPFASLPAYWWRSVGLGEGIDLTGQQISDLERAQSEHGEELERLQRDHVAAISDVRRQLAAEPFDEDATAAAAGRLRELQQTTFDRQVRLLVATRRTLSPRQWSRLQENIVEEEQPRMERQRRGGMGGGRPGGRRPGGRRP